MTYDEISGLIAERVDGMEADPYSDEYGTDVVRLYVGGPDSTKFYRVERSDLLRALGVNDHAIGEDRPND